MSLIILYFFVKKKKVRKYKEKNLVLFKLYILIKSQIFIYLIFIKYFVNQYR